MSHTAPPPAAHAHHDDDHASHAHVNYLAIFIALCVCTALSVVADKLMDWGVFEGQRGLRIVAVIVLAIAVAKAQFVMRYFMHLKFEGLWKYVLLLPTAILACGLPLALAPDIAMHYYTVENAPAATDDADGHAASGADHGHGAAEAPAAHH
ncbi:MAG: cytochrome C oxidase subunit IV family protein [Planctomycetaceae bacterium]